MRVRVDPSVLPPLVTGGGRMSRSRLRRQHDRDRRTWELSAQAARDGVTVPVPAGRLNRQQRRALNRTRKRLASSEAS